MAWLSPIKGAYPNLTQIDKTLPIDPEDGLDIVRGSVVYVTDANAFALADDDVSKDPTAKVYLALQGAEDFQAGMAGTVGYDSTHNDIVFGVARISAISIGQPMEWQTDQYDFTSADEDDVVVGALLTVGDNGKLVIHGGKSDQNIVGRITATPFQRWVNDAPVPTAPTRRTGANVTVLQFETQWTPAALPAPQ